MGDNHSKHGTKEGKKTLLEQLEYNKNEYVKEAEGKPNRVHDFKIIRRDRYKKRYKSK